MIVYLASSLAVLAAVAGQVWMGAGTALAGVEMGLLAVIAGVVYGNQRRSMTNHDRWLHFRQAAEALRLSALLHPLLASLPLLHRGVWKYDATETPQPVLAKKFHWFVIQLLREAGVPIRLSGKAGVPIQREPHCIETEFQDLAQSLDALIEDQQTYHERSTQRYENTHHRLRWAIAILFVIVCGAVFVHLVSGPVGHLSWLLLLTAFLPALGAALHGISSKAELQRLAKNSERMRARLKLLRRSIEGVRSSRNVLALRALALETAATMYAEHDAWADLMSDQPLELV